MVRPRSVSDFLGKNCHRIVFHCFVISDDAKTMQIRIFKDYLPCEDNLESAGGSVVFSNSFGESSEHS